jgi:hypothetical protein
MPERKNESGEQRQDRIQHEQHRPEQNRGYDEAVRGGRAVADDRPQVEDALPMPPDEESPSGESVDDRETQAAIEDVQRHEHSADRSVRPLKR